MASIHVPVHGLTYAVGASKLDEYACAEPTDACRPMAGIGGTPDDLCVKKVTHLLTRNWIVQSDLRCCTLFPKGCMSDPNWFFAIPDQNYSWFGRRYPIDPPGLPSGGNCNYGSGGAGANNHCCQCGGETYIPGK